MLMSMIRLHPTSSIVSPAGIAAVVLPGVLALALSLSAPAQVASPANVAPATSAVKPEAGSEASAPGGITEEELKQLLMGKALYLRGGYLDNSLSFNEHGGLIGHSAEGSYTLSGIQIDKIRLTRHKVELQGARYGLHFLGALPYEDPTNAADRVRITPKKKVLKITIDREVVVKPKKAKEKAAKPGKGRWAKSRPATAPAAETDEMSEEDQAKAQIAAASEAERPADPKSVTTTTSPAHATMVLKGALDRIFAQGLDERMMASMPDFWKL
jgi:hypothetical protein